MSIFVIDIKRVLAEFPRLSAFQPSSRFLRNQKDA